MKNKCGAVGCKRKEFSKKHNLCHPHYMRLWRHGDIGEGKIRKYVKLEKRK